MQVTKRIASILLLTLLALGSLVVVGQQPKKALTNEDVIRMVKEGLPDNVIVSTIQQFPANYDVSPDGLIQMKRQGVNGSVLTAVQEAQKVKGGKPTEVAASPESNVPPKRVSKVFNDFLFEFDVCQSSGGDSVTCRFLITNKAQERDLGITDGSYFIDSLRDQYSVADMWIGNRGKQFSLFTGVSASNTLGARVVKHFKGGAKLPRWNDATSFTAVPGFPPSSFVNSCATSRWILPPPMSRS